MKILFDEGVPKPLASALHGHDVSTVVGLGWGGVKNGKLLTLIEGAGFGAFITCDKNMEKQQPPHRRFFAILVLSTNHWPAMRPLVQAVAKALSSVQPGTVIKVECGTFVPDRFRKLDEPSF
ncbi:MAG TPA: hypothetical protein VHZ07_27230 [Bryobacteraceae bacterium]|nr:hypothetical protein [Bryobacteraceae bacterium]